jgi:hypothetical protein
MANRRSGDCEGLLRGPFCLAGAHEKCGHFHGFGIRPDPLRLRIEAFTNLCRCDCHSSCPVTNEKNTVSDQAWRQSCTCPGAEVMRTMLDEFGILPFGVSDYREMWAESQNGLQSRREAFKAAQARAAGKDREELKDLYAAELRARGLKIPER